MTDDEFERDLIRKFPQACDALRRVELRLYRRAQEKSRMFYGHGDPVSDEEILKNARRAN